MRYLVEKLMSVSDATTQTSQPLDASYLLALSVQAAFSDGGAAGTLKIQASNDKLTWTDVPSASATVASGASVLILLATVSYAWVRVVWTPTSGAGNLTVWTKATGF